MAASTLSPLGQYVVWAAERNKADWYSDPEVVGFVAGLYGKEEAAGTKLYEAGQQIGRGAVIDPFARSVRRFVYMRLAQNPRVVLECIDAFGYSPLTLRAVLAHHYDAFKAAPLDTDAYAVYIDISSGIEALSERNRVPALLLRAGYSPKEIGTKLKANGSRRITESLRELTKWLRPTSTANAASHESESG